MATTRPLRGDALETSILKATELTERFEARIKRQDPADPLTSDHHWNSLHPDYNPDCACGINDANQDHMAKAANTPVAGDGSPSGQRMQRTASKARRRAAQLMSDGQRRYVESLLERVVRLMGEENSGLVSAARKLIDMDWSTFGDASKMIDLLKAAVATDERASKRANRFAGACGKCGMTVEPEQGFIEQKSGAWVSYHFEGDCPEHNTEENAQSDDVADGLDLAELPSGRYADPRWLEDQTDDLSRRRLVVNNLVLDRARNPKWDGWVFVRDANDYSPSGKVGAQRPKQRYQGTDQDLLERIAADPKASAVEYGRITGCCGVCGRQLTDQASVDRGIGPVCATRF